MIKKNSLGLLDTTLCDKVRRWLVAGRWFSPGTPVSSINKTDRHDITEILLKGSLSTINYLPPQPKFHFHWTMSLYCLQYYLNYDFSEKWPLYHRQSQRINIFYKTFPALIYKQFLCYDVTITTGLLSRLHLQKQSKPSDWTSQVIRSYDAYILQKFCKISVGTLNQLAFTSLCNQIRVHETVFVCLYWFFINIWIGQQ